MAGHSAPKDARERAYVPAIYVLLARKTWMPATSAGMTEFASRCDNHLPDHLAVLDQPQALARLTERQHLVDHRLHLALLDQIHQAFQVLVVEAVRADDLELEAPDVAQVLLRVIAGGRAAHEQLAAALEAA